MDLTALSQSYPSLRRARTPSELRSAMVVLLSEALKNHSFAILGFDWAEGWIIPQPESPSTLEGLGLRSFEAQILSVLKSDYPKAIQESQYALVPLVLRERAVGAILVLGRSPVSLLEMDTLGRIYKDLEDRLELEINNHKLARELGQTLHNMGVLRSIAQAINRAQDMKHLLSMILKMAITTVSGARGFIMLQNEQTGELELKVAHGLPNPHAAELINTGVLKTATLGEGEGIQGQVLQSGEPMLVHREIPLDGEEDTTDGSNSIICVPLMVKNNSFGVLYITNRPDAPAFDKNDLDVLTILSAHVSSVVDQARLYTLATTDDLTGLFTRRYFSQKIGDEAKRAVRYKRHLAVLSVDIDHFKNVNDSFGHDSGDQVLKYVAYVLRKVIRQDLDTAVRLGGEEFVVILPETHLHGARTVAERMRQKMEEHEFAFGGRRLRVTISVGVTAYPENGSSIDELLLLSDQALYKAKSMGRNQVQCFPDHHFSS